jgi:transposase
MPTPGGKNMKKKRRRYDRDFKISVLAELDAGKPLAQVARENGLHPSLPCRWKTELAENPEKAFKGNGNKYKGSRTIFIKISWTVCVKKNLKIEMDSYRL